MSTPIRTDVEHALRTAQLKNDAYVAQIADIYAQVERTCGTHVMTFIREICEGRTAKEAS